MAIQIKESRNPFLEMELERESECDCEREYDLCTQHPLKFKSVVLIGCVLTSFVLPVFICLASLFNALLQNPLQQEIPQTVCRTTTCLNKANQIAQQVNWSTNPCEDFHEFSCGNLREKLGRKRSFLHDLQTKSVARLAKFYDEPYKYTDPVMVTASKKLYRACVAEFEEPRLVTTRIRKALWMAGLTSSPERLVMDEGRFDWLEQTYKLREVGLSHGMFLEVLITKHPEDKSRHIFKVGLPDMTMVEKGVLVEVAQMLGLDGNQTSSEIDETYRLMHILNMPDTYYSKDHLFDISQYREMHHQGKQLNWLRFINTILSPGLQASRHDQVVFPPIGQVMYRLKKLSKVPKSVQANYVMWKIVEEVAPDLILNLRRKHGFVPEDQKVETSEVNCLNLLRERLFPSAMDILYAQKYLMNKIEQQNTLAEDVKEQLFQVLDKADWLDEKDRERSIKILNDMTLVVGAPQHYFRDGLLDDLNVDMDVIPADNFLELLLQLNRNYQTFHYNQIKNPFLHWKLHLLDAHPHFSEDDVMVHPEIPAAVLEMFDEGRPLALNYAAMGTYIGSSQLGRLMFGTKPESGKDDMKWSNSTQEALIKKQKCLGEIFGSNSTAESLDLQMISEIISTKVAYLAYRERFLCSRNDKILMHLDLTNNQLFWVAAMSKWCRDSKYLELSLEESKYHSFRAVMMGANNVDFARDFSCSVGSSMNPGKVIAKCGVY